MAELNQIQVSGTTYDIRDTSKYTKPSTGIPDTDIASASTWNTKQGTAYSYSKATATTIAGALDELFDEVDGASASLASLKGVI